MNEANKYSRSCPCYAFLLSSAPSHKASHRSEQAVTRLISLSCKDIGG